MTTNAPAAAQISRARMEHLVAAIPTPTPDVEGTVIELYAVTPEQLAALPDVLRLPAGELGDKGGDLALRSDFRHFDHVHPATLAVWLKREGIRHTVETTTTTRTTFDPDAPTPTPTGIGLTHHQLPGDGRVRCWEPDGTGSGLHYVLDVFGLDVSVQEHADTIDVTVTRGGDSLPAAKPVTVDVEID